MSSATAGNHSSGAGPLSLMSCVRESSPLQDFDSDSEKNVATKKKFWNRLKWFKRKNKVAEDVSQQEDNLDCRGNLRSRSTSELSIDEPVKKRNSSSMHPGLSVSHDSVFHSPQSGSEIDLEAAYSSSSLSIPHQPQADFKLQTELSERLRLRRGRGDTSEDDEGLPHSPCNSPTTIDILDKTALKDLPNQSRSTCSDGSLLSMVSSDNEEDSFGQQSRHSSKLSLHDKRPTNHDFDLDLESSSGSAPLNHSAAHHKVAVRPKRTHGVPRKRVQQKPKVLPTTLEVNEDSSIRSTSPGLIPKENIKELYSISATQSVLSESQLKSSSLPPGLVPPGHDGRLSRSRSNAGSKSQDALEEDVEKDGKSDRSFFDRLFPRRSAKKKKLKQDEKTHGDKKVKTEEMMVASEETTIRNMEKFKNVENSLYYLSSQTHTRQEKYAISEENPAYHMSSQTHTRQENNVKSEENPLYDVSPTRKFPQVSESSHKRVDSKPIPAPRSGPAFRQRVLPIDIPGSPEFYKRDGDVTRRDTVDSASKIHIPSSPLQCELESRLKQRLTYSSPPVRPNPMDLSPQSPPLDKPESTKSPIISPVVMRREQISTRSTKYFETRKTEEIKRVKLVGLSALQQKILAQTEDEVDEQNSKSLTELPNVIDINDNRTSSNLLIKSHSFKSAKQIGTSNRSTTTIIQNDGKYAKNAANEEKRHSMLKAASLDSIKILASETTQSYPESKEQNAYTEGSIEITRRNSSNTAEEGLKEEEKRTQIKDSITVITSDSTKPKEEKLIQTKLVSEQIEQQREIKQQTKSIKCDITLSDNENLEEKISEYMQDTKNNQADSIINETNEVTISGPSHTAVVNVTNNIEHYGALIMEKDSSKEIGIKEQQISVTKINLKQHNTATTPDKTYPEFFNRQLHKVEAKSPTSVVFASPKIVSEQIRPTTVFNFDVDKEKQYTPRKSSKIEIDEKEEIEEMFETPAKSPPIFSISSMTPQSTTHYKKNEKNNLRKSSIVSINTDSSTREKPLTKCNSSSLDSLISDTLDSNDKNSSESSVDNLTEKLQETVKENDEDIVILRRKSVVDRKDKREDEPELMKVFARRSLKLKEGDTDIICHHLTVMTNENCDKTRDSDKENQGDSPIKERRKSLNRDCSKNEEKKTFNSKSEVQFRKKSVSSKEDADDMKVTKTEENNLDKRQQTMNQSNQMKINSETPPKLLAKSIVIIDTGKKEKEPLIECNNEQTKLNERSKTNELEIHEIAEVSLRKPSNNNNNVFGYQRAVSVNSVKTNNEMSQFNLKKQSSMHVKRRTDNWVIRNEDVNKEVLDLANDQIISDIVTKDDVIKEFIHEQKNFNQRKAEWEKRAQEAQKKSTP